MNICSLHSWYTLRELNRLLRNAENGRRADFTPQEGNFLYVPASCLPYHISGYTTRTHEILKSLKSVFDGCNAGSSGNKKKLFVLTRAGYPWDRKDALKYPEDGEFSILDDIRYEHTPNPKNKLLTVFYVKRAVAVFEKYIVENRIAVVHAASNHVNALPALIAARRLGIPFQYEMRGLWELTRVSRDPGFAKSHNFKLGLDLEALVATNADRVFVISEQLSEYIRKNWNVSPSVIGLLPNCADVERIKPSKHEPDDDKNPVLQAEKNDVAGEKKQVTIVYAGSLIIYEGIQTLLKAMSVLVHDEHLQVRLEILGDGEYRTSLEQLSAELKLKDHVFFLGRVSPDEAKRKQDECSIVCIPREPYDVCKIIPPIKMVEAMAKEKCVIVPDLPVFRDELGLGDSGCLFFKSGDYHDLARVLKENIYDAEGLREKGRKARQYVIKHRQWNQFTKGVYA